MAVQVVGFERQDQKPKFEDSWDPSASFVEYSGGAVGSTPFAGSFVQPANTCIPSSGQASGELDFRVAYGDNHNPAVTMLSSTAGWGSGSQYSAGTSSYPSSTSSAQSYYSGRSAMMAPSRGQHSLPSLTEMNLNSTPGYASRTSHPRPQPRPLNHLGSPPSTGSFFSQTTDSLDISYAAAKPTLTSTYTTPYSSFSPRSTYTHNPQYGSSMDAYSPTIDPYGYPNGHSWPPSLPYPTTYPNISDTASIGSGRRRRGNLPKHVTDILRTWFHDHLDHPYPTDEDKQMLISRTNLTISQVGVSASCGCILVLRLTAYR